MNRLKRWGRYAAWVSGSFTLVLIGVNLAPSIYGWQELAFSYIKRLPAPKPVPVPAVPTQTDITPVVSQLEARIRELESKPTGPLVDQAAIELRLNRAEMRPPAPEFDPAPLQNRIAQLDATIRDMERSNAGLREELSVLDEKIAPGIGTLPSQVVQEVVPVPQPGVKARPPKVLNDRQWTWAQDLPEYPYLHAGGMSDLDIVRRYGNPIVWALQPTQLRCQPGDLNCPLRAH